MTVPNDGNQSRSFQSLFPADNNQMAPTITRPDAQVICLLFLHSEYQLYGIDM